MDKVSIVLINYNGYKDTAECIESIRAIDYPDYEIIVVDNGSTNQSLDELRCINQKGLVIIESKENLGFSGGTNLGINYAMQHGSAYVLLLNNDTLVEPDFLKKLVVCHKKQPLDAVITPKIMYAYAPDIIWYAGGEFNLLTGRTTHTGIHEEDKGQCDKEKEVTFISGCCMLIPECVIRKIGNMSEKYFLYCEDLDYCCRMRQAGCKLYYCPESVIYHKVNACTGKNSDLVTYYTARNKRYIIKKFTKCRYIAFLYNYIEEMKRVICREYAYGVIKIARSDYKNDVSGRKFL